jgi:quercetin dioxygenase-like cupin family protein
MSGYEILSLDDLGRYESERHGESLLMPLRQRLGLRAFGANCWTAEAGKQIVPRHREESGDEELYVVVRGRARFTVDEETIDAPAGTLVHLLPGQVRQAFAEEPETIVLAVGATPGEAFEARGWDEVVVAFGEARAGNLDAGRSVLHRLVSRVPDAWQGAYNFACFEARFGDRDAAFDQLRRALRLGRGEALKLAQGDADFATLHDDERWATIVR